MKLSGNTFIVTGGASGLGAAVVKKLVDLGSNAVVFDVDQESAFKLSQDLGEDRVFVPGKVDVSQENQVSQALALAVERFGILAGTIICHGILGAPPTIEGYGPNNFLSSFKQVQYVVNVNLLGTYNVAQQVAAILIKQNPLTEEGERGAIITVSSIAGLDGSIVPYSTSKAGIAGLTLPLARELSSFGVRVMSIAPGMFDTPMTRAAGADFEAIGKKLQEFPQRKGNPPEFASTVIHILENSMLNGSVIRLDGAVRISKPTA